MRETGLDTINELDLSESVIKIIYEPTDCEQWTLPNRLARCFFSGQSSLIFFSCSPAFTTSGSQSINR